MVNMRTKGVVIVFCLAIILCFVSYLNSNNFFEQSYTSNADSVDNTKPKPDIKKKVVNMAIVSSKFDDDVKDIYKSALVSSNAFKEKVNVYNLYSKDSDDYKLQKDIIKNCVNKKYIGIILYKINLDKIKDELSLARKNDIYTIAIKCKGKKENVNTTLSSEVKNVGKVCANTMVKIIDKAKVYVIASKDDIDGNKYKEFKETVTSLNKNIELVPKSVKEKKKSEIKSIIESIIKDKDGVCGIFAFDDEIILKAMKILHDKDIYNIWLFAGKGTKELERNVDDSNICFCLRNTNNLLGQKACKCVMTSYYKNPIDKEVFIDAITKVVNQN